MGASKSSVPRPKLSGVRRYSSRDRVTLKPGQLYCFEGQDVGTFTLIGGSCGTFTVENRCPGEQCAATIYNERRQVIFSQGRCFGDSVTIRDNPEDGTTTVFYSRFAKVSVDHPIPITTSPNELIQLKGKRHFITYGDHVLLDYSGTGSVVVNGSAQRVKHTGSGEIRICGSVNGKVFQKCYGGRLFIDGNIIGNVVQLEKSMIEVNGNVYGTIEQGGNGEIRVWGSHCGSLFRSGRGRVLIGN